MLKKGQTISNDDAKSASRPASQTDSQPNSQADRQPHRQTDRPQKHNDVQTRSILVHSISFLFGGSLYFRPYFNFFFGDLKVSKLERVAGLRLAPVARPDTHFLSLLLAGHV